MFPNLAPFLLPVKRCVKMFLVVRSCSQNTEPTWKLRSGGSNERFQDFHATQQRVWFLRDSLSDPVGAPPAGLQLDLCGRTHTDPGTHNTAQNCLTGNLRPVKCRFYYY